MCLGYYFSLFFLAWCVPGYMSIICTFSVGVCRYFKYTCIHVSACVGQGSILGLFCYSSPSVFWRHSHSLNQLTSLARMTASLRAPGTHLSLFPGAGITDVCHNIWLFLWEFELSPTPTPMLWADTLTDKVVCPVPHLIRFFNYFFYTLKPLFLNMACEERVFFSHTYRNILIMSLISINRLFQR